MLKNVYEGKTLIFNGPYTLTFREGLFEAMGISPNKDERVTVSENKRLPVFIKKSGKIEVRDDFPKGIEEIVGSTIPASWEKLVEKILKENFNSIIIIGSQNSGKTTLSQYLINRLVDNSKRVSLIDSDLGQSDIGPAGAIGLTVCEKKIFDYSECKLYKFHFVGSMSPTLHSIETLVGFKKLTAAAMMNSDILLVDSSGWIDGDAGRTLKQAKIEMINPDLIVLIQKDGECEHLIKNLNNHRIFRVGVSQNSRKKDIAERKKNRMNSVAAYMNNAQTVKLSLKKIKLRRCFFTTGAQKEIPENLANYILHIEKLGDNEGHFIVLKKHIESDKMNELKKKFGKIKVFYAGSEANTYVGLANENNDFIGVGIIEKIDFFRDNIYIITTVDAMQIKSVHIGSLKIDAFGNELGFIEPGAL